MLNILVIEPFYTGSHQQWADGLKKHSSHSITLLTLSGNHWKWRMHGGAITLAAMYQSLNQSFDIILCSDMMDVALFLSLIDKQGAKIGTYFHENQLTYPWSENDPDIALARNIQYGFINYTSALCSDFVWFNSHYHRDSFIEAVIQMLHKFPNHKNLETLTRIQSISSTVYFGLPIKSIHAKRPNAETKTKEVILLWNHRWEYDKNPELFFKVLFELKNRGILFKLIVVGESYKQVPAIFNEALVRLKEEIIHWGYCATREAYLHKLYQADILLVTSHQDFFGISVLEATACGVFPLMPFRLAYPEHFPTILHDTLFYDYTEEGKNLIIALANRVQRLIFDIKYPRGMNLFQWIQQYDWEERIKAWDQKFRELVPSS
jgi:glycosyltransferase involved in cell wall biosynthesis